VIVHLREVHKKQIRTRYRQSEESFNVTAHAYMQYANIILFLQQKVGGQA